MKTLILCLCMLFVASAGENYGVALVANIDTVYDGDTFYADLAGIHPIAGMRIGVRIYGIDTPEMPTKTGKPHYTYLKAAKSAEDTAKAHALSKWALEGRAYAESLLVNSGKVILQDMIRGKYFRIVAKVCIDGEDFSEKMIESKYALPYDGKAKTDWMKVELPKQP